MKIVLQRVVRAEVRVGNQVVGQSGPGLLLLVGIEKGDTPEQVDAAADRVLQLRIFGDEERRMNRSCLDVRGDILAVPQFTLAATLRRGRRPSFENVAPGSSAEPLFLRFVERMKATGLRVEAGSFGARMAVELINDGPVTFIL
ncbi:MAG: D-aminoacyl-tRNA deacylase [Acidobacteria bacterium]|nr:D-aminoacyl-tRNA deacylase [Acidobacteriota bacterium]